MLSLTNEIVVIDGDDDDNDDDGSRDHLEALRAIWCALQEIMNKETEKMLRNTTE